MLRRQMPKEEIGAVAFLRDHPDFDGRGVVVAVFDTGVDPGAEGLQVCPDGRPKMLDVIDATGAGDVDTSTAAAPAADGTLPGVSGRALALPGAWPAPKPGTKYHLGVKRAFELYPGPLASRVKAERRKALDAAQRDAVAACQAALLSPPDEATVAGKKMAEELRTRAALLERLAKEHEDVGPLYDVVAFEDAEGAWRVCVDTSEAGDLAACTLLEPFRVGRQYGTLDAVSLLNYAVDVMDGGRRCAARGHRGACDARCWGTVGTRCVRGRCMVTHGVSMVTHGVSMVTHGASMVTHGASMVTHGASKVTHGTSMVAHGASMVTHGASMVTHGVSMVSACAAWSGGAVGKVRFFGPIFRNGHGDRSSYCVPIRRGRIARGAQSLYRAKPKLHSSAQHREQ